MNDAQQERELNRAAKGFMYARAERPASFGRTAFWVLISATCYYLATQIAWALCFPDSKVSLFFPPHAILVSVLLLVPTRHWWAYTLAAISVHFMATQQAHWPVFYSLHCEAFDAVQNMATAAGLRFFIKSPLKLITLRDAIVFVLIAVVIVPFGAAFWGAAFTISNHFGTHYWIEWRSLGISNAVTAIVLVPAILLGVSRLHAPGINVTPARLIEAMLLGASILVVGIFTFDRLTAGPNSSPALLYAPIALLIWAALRFGLGGVSASVLAVTFQAVWGTMHGYGPFLTQTPGENALALQAFLLVMAIPLMLLAVMVEEEKRSKNASLESEERLTLAAEAAEFGVWVWNITTNQIWGSERWRRLFGFAPGDDIGFENLFQRIHPEDREIVEREVRGAATDQVDHLREYRIVLPDGTQHWIASRGRIFPEEIGKPDRFFGAAIDITERKQAAAELIRQRAELAHVARVSTMGELAASVAHELNQPLGAILANAEAAELFLQQEPPAFGELRATLADIRKDDERASEVIRRMRALLRKHELELQPLDINSVAEEALQLVSGDAALRRISLAADLLPFLPKIAGDRVHLQQVLLNLILNGMDAMHDQARDRRQIQVRTRLGADGLVELAVIDSGHGLEPNKLSRLFEPFYTTKPNGMGMGLSIARTIIDAHHGRIWAENNAVRGAVFRITLPVLGGQLLGDKAK